MPNYLSRKKTLMGKRYELEVTLEQYGGDVVRVHAIPDLELAQIESRTGYKLEDALAAFSSNGLTDAEIAALNAEPLSPALAEKVSRELTEEELKAVWAGQISPEMEAKLSKAFSSEEIALIKVPRAGKDLMIKTSKALSPQLTLFLGELCRAGIVPNPDCACKGKGCPDCDVTGMVDELRSYSVLAIGMAVIGASTASWENVQSFFSQKKVSSGAALPA